jgi:wyosine [tRNA(Phe)-imidazoG37] synthetase (radical SAM superfamily)
VRAAACKANIVKGTLAAWDQSSFEALHHPHPSLIFTTFINGLKAMRSEFQGEFWLEVFLVAGVNDAPEQVARIATLANVIRPDRIHLNTAVRPPQAVTVQAVSSERLADLARVFTPVAELSVSLPASAATGGRSSVLDGLLEGRLLSLIQRHPCTVADMVSTMGADQQEVEKVLSGLVERVRVRTDLRQGTLFYVAV